MAWRTRHGIDTAGATLRDGRRAGRRATAALLATLLAIPGAALASEGPAAPPGALAQPPEAMLEVVAADGAVLARLPLGAEPAFCLHWSHSVTGGPVADCFRLDGSAIWLERSYLHDFAAGLGHIPGRGRQVAAPDGGYWIEDIAAPLPPEGLALRVGRSPVGHRIETAAATLQLSELAAGQRVTLRASGRPATP